jgi:hypothetical protein
MPTLSVRFDAALSGSDLTARVNVQAGQLGALAEAVGRLTHGELPGLGELERALGELPAPDVAVPGDFAGAISALADVLPADAGGALDAVLDEVRSLADSLDGLAKPLTDALAAVDAVIALTGIDLSCAADGRGSVSVSGAAEAAAGAAAAGAAATTAPAPAGAPAPSPTTAALREVRAALQQVPASFDVGFLLERLADALDKPQIDSILARPIPIVHELRDTLGTLARWHTISEAALAMELGATIDAAAALVQAQVAGVAASVAGEVRAFGDAIPAAELAAAADTLAARLDALAGVITAGDDAALAAATAEVDAAMDAYEALRAPLAAAGLEARAAALAARLRSLPDDLEDGLSHVLSVLRPDASLGDLPFLQPGPPVPREAGAPAFAALEAKLSSAVIWLQDVLRKVDLGPFVAQVQRVQQAVDDAASTVEARIDEATVRLRGLFARLESQLAAIDVDGLVEAVRSATHAFVDTVTSRLTALLATVRDGVAAALEAVAERADQFDPDNVVGALRDAIQALGGVLQDPEVKGVADQVRGAIEGAAGQLASVSFAPVADEVIRGIDAIGAELDKIDESKLNGPLRAALGAAVSVLPPSIEPISVSLTGELGGLIEGGPLPALNAVQARIGSALDGVRRFEPAALLGDALSHPYQGLLAELNAFAPTRVLDPARARLGGVRERLKRQVSPGRAIQPLEPPYAALLAGFDRLSPEALARPVEEELGRVADAALAPVLAAIDAATAPVAALVARVRAVADPIDAALDLLRELHRVVSALKDVDAGTRAWVNGALDRVGALAEVNGLRLALGRLDAAFEATTVASLEGALAAAAEPVRARLDLLRGDAKLAAVVQARRGAGAAPLAARPDSPAKAAAAAALARCDPLAPDFGSPFRGAAALGQALAAARSGFTAAMGPWDAVYHGQRGVTACMRGLEATPAGVRAWLAEALEKRFTQPVIVVLSRVETFAGLVEPLVAVAETVATALHAAVDALLAAPEALLHVRDALHALADRIRGLGGETLRAALGGVFGEVRGKLEAVSPARLRALVEEEFGRVLDTLAIDAALPDLGVLDSAHADLVAKAQALDPGKLVVEVVQPEFDATLKPLIEAFDLTASIELLVAKLHGLEDELHGELRRVDEAYQRLLRSIPGGGLEVSVSASVEL